MYDHEQIWSLVEIICRINSKLSCATNLEPKYLILLAFGLLSAASARWRSCESSGGFALRAFSLLLWLFFFLFFLVVFFILIVSFLVLIVLSKRYIIQSRMRLWLYTSIISLQIVLDCFQICTSSSKSSSSRASPVYQSTASGIRHVRIAWATS